MKQDKQAYPQTISVPQSNNHSGNPTVFYHFGLTRREVFAKAAMEGILASPDSQDRPFKFSSALVATAAVNYADDLIAELDKEEGSNE